MDFTFKKYTELLSVIKNYDYTFQPFKEFLEKPNKRSIILRHDVDLLPENALKIAQIENNMGIRSTFYFQISPRIYKIEIVKKIHELGHEIGYHYKDIETVTRRKPLKLNDSKNIELIIDLAYERFVKNLELMRKDFDIRTICMHGSPRFRLDNRIIWQKYDYRKLDIIGEPYYDIDWNEVGYLTDSSRSWNGEKFIVRDKVNSKFNYNLHSTQDIIGNIDKLEEQLMITTHPQRWSNNKLFWIKEYLFQNIKNLIKKKFYT